MRVALAGSRRFWFVVAITVVAAITIVAGISSQTATIRASEMAAAGRGQGL
jgi:hypothetical protein